MKLRLFHLFLFITIGSVLVVSVTASNAHNTSTHTPEAAQANAQGNDAPVLPDGFMPSIKDYGAKGDGVTDDTAAIQAALDDERVDENGKMLYPSPDDYNGRTKALYFPPGTYLVSDKVGWVGCCLTIHGAGSSKTTIKLIDSAVGFDDPENPKPVIQTEKTNEAFRNNIWHLTVDTGKNNPGAVGVDYIASNHGSMRDVVIRSGDGQGARGIDLTRKWPGPLMIKDVMVEGFDIGIDINHGEYGMTLENITLKNQKQAGLQCATNTVSLRKLTSVNKVPAIRTRNYNYNPEGPGICTMVVLDSELTGGASDVSAIESSGLLYARNITTSGYQSAIEQKGTIVEGANVSEYSSKTEMLFENSPARSLNLPIAETPTFEDPNMENWAGVECTGYYPSCGVAGSLREALDSGKATVYFPFEKRQVYDELTITVPPTVRRIVGYSSITNGGGKNGGGIKFVVADDHTEPLIIEQFGYGIKIEHTGKRTLVLKDSKFRYKSKPGAGNLFLENVEIHNFTMYDSQKVWARQFNNERRGDTKITNNGGQLWVFGIKTEGTGTVLDNRDGAKTEMLGVFVLPAEEFDAEEKKEPIFRSTNASFSAVYSAIAYSEAEKYGAQVIETRGDETRTMLTKDAPMFYSRMGLYVGHNETAPPKPEQTPQVYLPMIQSMSLINADTDEPIAGYETLTDDVTLDLATLPTENLSLRANTEPAQVGSVQFAIDGQVIQTENHLPYVAAGDANSGQNILPMSLPEVGTHTVTVTPYTQPRAQGEAGPPLTFELEIPG